MYKKFIFCLKELKENTNLFKVFDKLAFEIE